MTEDLEISDYACVGDILQVSPLTFYRYNINPTKKKITLLNDDVDEKICPYVNVTGIITNFNTEDHSFNMCPTQYIALPRTTSPLPLHGYFMESKRWGDGKKPTLSLGSTIAFGGFIDRI